MAPPARALGSNKLPFPPWRLFIPMLKLRGLSVRLCAAALMYVISGDCKSLADWRTEKCKQFPAGSTDLIPPEPALAEYQPRIRIIGFEGCTADYLPVHLNLLKKFLNDDYEYILVDDSKDGVAEDVQRAAIAHGAKYSSCALEFPTNSTRGSQRIGDCLNFAYDRFVKGYNGVVLVTQTDMFLIRPFGAVEYLRTWGAGFSAMIENQGTCVPYLHWGLHIVDTRQVPDAHLIRWDTSGGCDTGGASADFLQTHPELPLHPMLWSRHLHLDSLHALRLIPRYLRDFVEDQKLDSPFMPDLFTDSFAFLHMRASCNWINQDDEAFGQRKWVYLRFAHQILHDDIQATYEDFSAVTTAKEDPQLSQLSNWTSHQIVLAKTSADPGLGKPVQHDEWYATADEEHNNWWAALYRKADEVRERIKSSQASLEGIGKIPLPNRPPAARTNVNLHPPRYDRDLYVNDTTYYWRYVYNGSQDQPRPPAPCEKRPGQKYWVATYAVGEKRINIAQRIQKPTCLQHVADEWLFFTDRDLDPEFLSRNSHILNHSRGVGLWIWKHWVWHRALELMQEGDILMYLDSDMGCTEHTAQYYCLAQQQDVVGLHHSHGWYTLDRLASRDSMTDGHGHPRTYRPRIRCTLASYVPTRYRFFIARKRSPRRVFHAGTSGRGPCAATGTAFRCTKSPRGSHREETEKIERSQNTKVVRSRVDEGCLTDRCSGPGRHHGHAAAACFYSCVTCPLLPAMELETSAALGRKLFDASR